MDSPTQRASTPLGRASSGSLAPGSRRTAAVRVRLGEKEALDATLRYFEDRIGRCVRGLALYRRLVHGGWVPTAALYSLTGAAWPLLHFASSPRLA